MKNKSLQLLVIGLLLILLGAVLKVLKIESYSNILMAFGLVLEICAGIFIVVNRISPKKR